MNPIQAETEDVYCQQIDQNSREFQPGNPENWRHIPGKINPADHGTRGLKPSDITKLWPISEHTSRLLKICRRE